VAVFGGVVVAVGVAQLVYVISQEPVEWRFIGASLKVYSGHRVPYTREKAKLGKFSEIAESRRPNNAFDRTACGRRSTPALYSFQQIKIWEN
jgi:hypothetical protein